MRKKQPAFWRHVFYDTVSPRDLVARFGREALDGMPKMAVIKWGKRYGIRRAAIDDRLWMVDE